MKFLFDVLDIVLNVSWVADLSGMVVAVALGFLWYHPLVFGNAWMQLSGLKQEDVKSVKAQNALLWTLPITFIIAANIAAFCKKFNFDTPEKGFLVGYDLGLIICLFMAIHALYAQQPLKLYLINAGYTLLAMSLMGIVISILV